MEQVQQEQKKDFLHGITWGKGSGLLGLIVGAITGEILLGNLKLGAGVGLIIGIALGWLIDKKRVLSQRPTHLIVISILMLAIGIATLTFLIGTFLSRVILEPATDSYLERSIEKGIQDANLFQ